MLTPRSLDARVKKRLSVAKTSRRLDLSSSPACPFNFKSLPDPVLALFADHAEGKVDGQLKELWLSNNSLPLLTPKIWKLAGLDTLCLSNNSLKSLPVSVSLLQKLKRLMLDGNRLSSIPKEVSSLSLLEEIRLDRNQFSEFPLSLTNVRSLKRIGLSNNQIGPSIPQRIRRLGKLIELDLDDNKIRSVPLSVKFLAGTLQQLGLARNCLGKLPEVVEHLHNLEILRIEENREHRTSTLDDNGNAEVVHDIPSRHDGYAEIFNVTSHGGGQQKQLIAGYVDASFSYNIRNANSTRGDDLYEMRLLKTRAQTRRSAAKSEEKK